MRSTPHSLTGPGPTPRARCAPGRARAGSWPWPAGRPRHIAFRVYCDRLRRGEPVAGAQGLVRTVRRSKVLRSDAARNPYGAGVDVMDSCSSSARPGSKQGPRGAPVEDPRAWPADQHARPARSSQWHAGGGGPDPDVDGVVATTASTTPGAEWDDERRGPGVAGAGWLSRCGSSPPSTKPWQHRAAGRRTSARQPWSNRCGRWRGW
ncbi:hypothetical protein HBB16_20755 [Pseudonocardia sp. MCCB 268]|nr:hypothetical protein [Pseudonocardia cytotoxica]